MPVLVDASKLPRHNPRIPAEAVSAARQSIGSRVEVGLCSHTVGAWYGWGGSGAHAWNLWLSIAPERKHAGDRNPPAGALVFYAGGKYGHVALALGDGRIVTTDLPTSGRIGVTELNAPEHAWRYTYAGWSVPHFPQAWGPIGPGKPAPVVLVPVTPPANPERGGSTNPHAPLVHLSLLRPEQHSPDVRLLQRALRTVLWHAHGSAFLRRVNPSGATGYYGAETVALVRSVQRLYGFTGRDVNGIIGWRAADRLGRSAGSASFGLVR